MNDPRTLRELSCADDYDPNSMPVERARALIRQFLKPITTIDRVHIRFALDRILAEDITSPIDVPGHDNSAMDGWAIRFADLKTDGVITLKRVGESFAGKPCGSAIKAGEAVENAAVVRADLIRGKEPPPKALKGVIRGDNFVVPLAE